MVGVRSQTDKMEVCASIGSGETRIRSYHQLEFGERKERERERGGGHWSVVEKASVGESKRLVFKNIQVYN
jgi:hypothetical protein